MMQTHEQKTKAAFAKAKDDIITLQEQVVHLFQRLQHTEEQLMQTRKELSDLRKHYKQDEDLLVASEKGKKFHKGNCPYAQNIKPKQRLVFASVDDAKNKGLKPCQCIE